MYWHFQARDPFHMKTNTTMALILLILILVMVAMVISICVFVGLLVRAAKRELRLCSAYMKQIEKTNQAERKSMKQSLAFASANHDVRGYLACIKVLIELSYIHAPPSSELASNLKKIDVCAEDLLGLVNSILDFSKIEAGKMELQNSEFDLAQLLEDIVDLHHPVAMKKGVDVILDPCDGSVMKFSRVKGDPGKLKQILSNLLSNAVKFTPQGHISIRAWAKKPSFENSIIASNRNSYLNRLSRLFYTNKKAYDDVQEIKTVKQDPNCIEFVFEVDDTGPGIPKEKRKSIFENFVQVRENSDGQDGTGLGLGIVQSLVRLMGGDIEVVDKANGERGTCFQFNIFLVVQENASTDNARQERIEFEDAHPNTAGLSSCTWSPSLKCGSLVVVLINNEERRRVVSKYIENLGVKLVVLKQANNLSRTLKEKINPKVNASQYYYTSPSGGSGDYTSGRVVPLSMMDGLDDSLPVYIKSNLCGPVRCILLVVDANAGNFQDLCRSVSELRRDLHSICVKVVWLERPDTRRTHFSRLSDEDLSPNDCIISQPLHGSRLKRVISFLPEFGGHMMTASTEKRISSKVPPSPPRSKTEVLASSGSEEQLSAKQNRRISSIVPPSTPQSQTEVLASSISEEQLSAKQNRSSKVTSERFASRTSEIEEIVSATKENVSLPANVEVGGLRLDKPLHGKKFLLAEDVDMLKKIAESFLTRWGARVELCENGKEAFELISRALNGPRDAVPSQFPYDYVLMDCQMPVMDGFEATKRIREEEKKYGVHIPIIALTSHEVGDEGNKIVDAGMDFHLQKPLKKDKLLEVIRQFEDKFR